MGVKKPKKHVKYQGVSLPIPLIKKIKKHIANDVTYQTVPNYVRDAVREKMHRDKIENMAKGFHETLDIEKEIVEQDKNKVLEQYKKEVFERYGMRLVERQGMVRIEKIPQDKRIKVLEGKINEVLKLLKNKDKKSNNNTHGLS